MLDNMTLLVLQLGVIILAARLGGALFERMRMPAIVGEIIAGMLIGPYCLGSITIPVFGHVLFPLHGSFPVSAELYGFTTVASIILLFLVGLKTDLEMFLRYSVAGSAVGIGGVVVSFIFGDLVTVFFSKYLFGVHYGFGHPVPMFLGVISTATSVGITARILSDNKKIHSPEGVTIISGAVVDDVIGVIILAVVIAVSKSGHLQWKQISGIAAKALVTWLGFTALGLAFSRHIGILLKKSKDTTTITVMSLGMALILAGIFEKAGLAMIIGAYVMGLSLSRTDLDYVIQEKLAPLDKFFVPMFFCVMGMMVDFSTMGSGLILFFGLLYTLASIFSKVLGCGMQAFFLNFNLRGALRVGLGMAPRGEVTMLMAGIGLSAGILQQDMLGVVVLMTIVNALFTPILLGASLKSEGPVLRKEVPRKETRSQITFDMPTPETASLVLSSVVSFFHNDAFYVHRIDLSEIERLYQIRKDRTFIGLKASLSQLQFDCKEEDAVFVHTLIYEVLAELENTMKKLQSLTDKASIGKKIFDKKQDRPRPRKGSLKQIHPDAVEANLGSGTKEDIIKEMVGLLIISGQLAERDRERALTDVLEREEVMSTGMQDGFALPHAKTDVVKGLICAVGVHKSGVDFNSLDGEPSHIFVIILSPKGITGPHIRLMADVSQLLMDKSRREGIIACKTSTQLYQTIIG
ncbi:MAG: cation:proton antiporter [Candidatus Omnitrophica bacterium]|nr:cation:proton antiporter [Candidatus Omnitrophota bacterium]